MSVILDALRRARQGKAAGDAGAARHAAVPAGLRGASHGRPRASGSSSRRGLLLGVIVIAATIYAGVRFGPTLMRRQPAAVLQTAAPAAPVTGGPAGAGTPAAETAPAPGPGTPSITEMLDRIKEPPAVAPRAMAPVTRAEAPPAGAATARGRGPAPRPVRTPEPRPIPSAPPAAITAPAAAAVPVAPAINHFELAVRHHSLGNFEQALKHYLALLETDEFNAEARNNLGLLYHERGLSAEAIDQFRRAILINPRYLRARSNLAVVLLDAGRLAEARAELRAAQAQEPRSADVLVNLALVEKADQQPGTAQELLLRALGYQPTHAAAHYNLGLIYEETGNRARAVDHYGAFLKYAGPEHGSLLTDVHRRIDELMPRTLPR